MNENNEITVNISALIDKNQRLDSYLATVFSSKSRASLTKLIKSSAVTINNRIENRHRAMLKNKDVIKITFNETNDKKLEWLAEDIDINIVYEDDDIIVINKPDELTVHPGAGQSNNTLANALLYHNSELAKLPRVGIVHRLDKDTTGLMVVAKTIKAQLNLIKQLQERTVKRVYHAIVCGSIISGGRIDEPIGRNPKKRIAMAVIGNGKEAITDYRVIQRFKKYTLLELSLKTGRTHQIRVHMSFINHSILGDALYGHNNIVAGSSSLVRDKLQRFKRQALHAKELSFIHPITNKEISFISQYPKDIAHAIHVLEKDMLDE